MVELVDPEIMQHYDEVFEFRDEVDDEVDDDETLVILHYIIKIHYQIVPQKQ
jgi:hypothetical protein